MSLARIPLKVTLTIEDRDRNIQPHRRTFLAHGTFPFREELFMLKALYAALVMMAAGGIVAVQAQRLKIFQFMAGFGGLAGFHRVESSNGI
jgi:hypothetical protein